MTKPVVALVGRPNVGKSTLFNRLVGERMAIVDDTPGTTRDRIFADSDWNGVVFTVVAVSVGIATERTRQAVRSRSSRRGVSRRSTGVS